MFGGTKDPTFDGRFDALGPISDGVPAPTPSPEAMGKGGTVMGILRMRDAVSSTLCVSDEGDNDIGDLKPMDVSGTLGVGEDGTGPTVEGSPCLLHSSWSRCTLPSATRSSL